jgi:hypothetical protein
MMHLKPLEKQEQTNHTTIRWRKIIKMRVETNEIKTKKTIQRISEKKLVL